MKKFLLLSLSFILSPIAARAATCDAGYYLDNDTCTRCPGNNYCVGDDTATPCPAITYTKDQLKQKVEDRGYTVTSIGTAHLWSTWRYSQIEMTTPEHCLLSLQGFVTTEGTLFSMFFRYSSETNNYTTFHATYWMDANPGYYLSDNRSAGNSNRWLNIKPCTNPYPTNAHYSGPGTPDSADGTIVDANDCPWVCDDGYYGKSANGDTTCTICPAGYFCVNGNLSSCPAGYNYNTATGNSAIRQCQTHCDAETYIANGEYTRLEYLESTGTQYIDTEIIPTTDMVFDITFERQTTGWIMGRVVNQGSSADMGIAINAIRFGTQFVKDKDFSSKTTVKLSKNEYYINGVKTSWPSPGFFQFQTVFTCFGQETPLFIPVARYILFPFPMEQKK